MIRHVVVASFIVGEAVIFTYKESRDRGNVLGRYIYGECFGCHVVVGNGDIIGTGRNRVLAVFVAIAVNGDCRIERGNVEIDGRYPSGLPDENNY